MLFSGESYCCCWSLLCSVILRCQTDSVHLHVILHEWIAFYSAFWIRTKVVYLQRWHGWCHMKLLLSQRILRTTYNHAPCHFMQSHIRKVHACLAVTIIKNMAEWPGFFTCYCGNTWILKQETVQKVDPGEENSPTTPAGIQTRDLSIMSPAL